MGEYVVCPICPEIAETKKRPMRQGTRSIVEMKLFSGGLGGYCQKCRMFGYSTLIRKVQEYDPETKEISFKYIVETNWKKEKELVNEKKRKNEEETEETDEFVMEKSINRRGRKRKQ